MTDTSPKRTASGAKIEAQLVGLRRMAQSFPEDDGIKGAITALERVLNGTIDQLALDMLPPRA